MHVYPSELVALISERWGPPPEEESETAIGVLPGKGALEHLISTCYQVSMMREEDRSVTLRIILAPPSVFPPDQGPPKGFLRLQPANAGVDHAPDLEPLFRVGFDADE